MAAVPADKRVKGRRAGGSEVGLNTIERRARWARGEGGEERRGGERTREATRGGRGGRERER